MVVINPYTFVPLWDEPQRSEPSWHTSQGFERFDGWFAVTIDVKTPLLVGPLNDADDPKEPPRQAQGDRIIIPGSSVMGAVRSLHEAMNDSCLRIVDLDYRAVHRHAITTHINENVQMAVVTEATDDGIPTEVALCGADVRWVEAGALAPVHEDGSGRVPRTGDTYSLDHITPTARGNKQLIAAQDVGPVTTDPRGEWVLLVTDTRARPRTVKVRGVDVPTRVWYACGRPDRKKQRLTVGPEAQEAFARAIEGTSDRHGRAAEDETPYADVGWPPATDGGPEAGKPPIARRLRSRKVESGTPVWVEIVDEAVREVRLSLAWRRTSKTTVADRVRAWAPCTDPSQLCPSCRIFGSGGDDDKDRDGPSRQRSYRGHVRIDDAVAVGMRSNGQLVEGPVVLSDPIDRAPLGAPRPTAGQFYLDNSQQVDDDRPIEGGAGVKRPWAQWDSHADAGPSGPRGIRGRKFYWRTTYGGSAHGFPGRKHRGLAREHHRGNGQGGDSETSRQVKAVRLVAAGAVFTTRVAFENLTKSEIGSLLAAVSPHRTLNRRAVTSLGGGKPFGWGAVRMQVADADFTATPATVRYLGLPHQSTLTPGTCLDAFVEDSGGTDWVTAHAPLAKALTLNAVSDGQVWYPAATGEERGTKEFDDGFELWKQTAGLKFLRRDGSISEERPLRSLPHVSDETQALPEL